MAEININFTLTQSGDAGGSQSGENSVQVNSPSAQQTRRHALRMAAGFNIAKRLGMQVAHGFVGSIGSWTGNYVLQEQIQTAMSLTGRVATIAGAFAVNPVGGVVALAATGISVGFEIANRQREIMWQNRSAAELRRRAGYNSNANR